MQSLKSKAENDRWGGRQEDAGRKQQQSSLSTYLEKNEDGVTLALLERDFQPHGQQWVWQEMTALGLSRFSLLLSSTV